MSLQFNECHTKIRHVDAHATLNDGVVVQVLGELSNNGQPMRKFMQTFVLAPEVSTSTLTPILLLAEVLDNGRNDDEVTFGNAIVHFILCIFFLNKHFPLSGQFLGLRGK